MADIQKTKFTNLNGDNLIVLPDTDEANNGDVLTFTNDEGTSALKWAAGGSPSFETTDLVPDGETIVFDTTATPGQTIIKSVGGGGAEYSAGMDLTINNNVIAVNTYSCAVNSAKYAFV